MNSWQLQQDRKPNDLIKAFQILSIVWAVDAFLSLLFKLPMYFSYIDMEFTSPAYILFAVFVSLFSIVSGIIWVVLCAKRSKAFPTVFLILNIVIFVLEIFDYIFSFYAKSLSSFFQQFIFALIPLGLAIAFYIYLQKSQSFKIYILDEPTYQQYLAFSMLPPDQQAAYNATPQNFYAQQQVQNTYYPASNSHLQQNAGNTLTAQAPFYHQTNIAQTVPQSTTPVENNYPTQIPTDSNNQ